MRRSLGLIGGMVILGLSACVSREERPRANDPFGELSAAEIYTRKGVRYLENGALDIALRDLTHAIRLDPRNSEAHGALAVLYERLGHAGKAEAHYREALSTDPDNYSAHNNFGRFLCDQGRAEEAMAEFRLVIDEPIYALPWLPLTNAGRCLERMGRSSAAEEYLRKALDRYPEYPPALLEMARVSLARRQYLSARGFLQRYHAVAAKTADSLWLNAQTELALGDIGAAQEAVRELRREFPDSAEAQEARRLFQES
ncbi:MAG TPA: type IV pilus biogenesis/stability protein PilW [Methylococcus sp.]|nr:type IV pilus biogenesis/stability protein PilW [Methylococcus sp.]